MKVTTVWSTVITDGHRRNADIQDIKDMNELLNFRRTCEIEADAITVKEVSVKDWAATLTIEYDLDGVNSVEDAQKLLSADAPSFDNTLEWLETSSQNGDWDLVKIYDSENSLSNKKEKSKETPSAKKAKMK